MVGSLRRGRAEELLAALILMGRRAEKPPAAVSLFQGSDEDARGLIGRAAEAREAGDLRRRAVKHTFALDMKAGMVEEYSGQQGFAGDHLQTLLL